MAYDPTADQKIVRSGNEDVPRCYKPPRFGKVKKAEFHQFKDASFKDYSQSSYLRMIDERGKIHHYFVTGKTASITLLKSVTVPRLLESFRLESVSS